MICFEKTANNCFNLTIPVVMKIAVASLGNFHAKPFGPELQVKQMLDGRLRRKKMNQFYATVCNKRIILCLKYNYENVI